MIRTVTITDAITVKAIAPKTMAAQTPLLILVLRLPKPTVSRKTLKPMFIIKEISYLICYSDGKHQCLWYTL